MVATWRHSKNLTSGAPSAPILESTPPRKSEKTTIPRMFIPDALVTFIVSTTILVPKMYTWSFANVRKWVKTPKKNEWKFNFYVRNDYFSSNKWNSFFSFHLAFTKLYVHSFIWITGINHLFKYSLFFFRTIRIQEASGWKSLILCNFSYLIDDLKILIILKTNIPAKEREKALKQIKWLIQSIKLEPGYPLIPPTMLTVI